MKFDRYALFAFTLLIVRPFWGMPTASTPVFSPAAGTYTGAQLVKITDATAGATIYYTTNGTTPTTASTKYTAAFAVSATDTIKAIAVATGDSNSAVASAPYIIEAAEPVFSPKAGTYAAAQSVKITDSTAGATIYYTTNGTTPTIASTKYTATIAVSETDTIKAIAVAKGDSNSAVASAAYIIEAAEPVFSPKAGTYSTAQTVEITDATAAATIYYTTNGTTPTSASTKYGGAFKVSATETVEAIAIAKGLASSPVAKAIYTITPSAKFTIGGKVSGLEASDSVVLLDNGGNALTVAANGGFTFTTPLASGAAYAVTVGTEPKGESCTVGSGSGKVGSADITSVTVSCAATSTGPGSAFWIPFAATPTSATGQAGLFVIASNTIAAATPPVPKFVTKAVPTVLGAAAQGFVSATTPPTAETPALIVYAAVGPDGNSHVYGLNLSNTSATPVPAQLTNLSVPPSKHICQSGQVQSDLTTPSSLSVVIYVTTGSPGSKPGTVGYCGFSPGTYELISYTDGPAVDPTVLDIPGGTSTLSALENDISFSPLYEDTGKLGGVLLWDAATKDENFYPDETFAGGKTLLSDVGFPLPCINAGAISQGASGSLFGRLLASANNGKTYTAYQFTSSGAAPTEFFSGDAGGCLTDGTNLFFTGTPSSSATEAIYQEPVAATLPAQKLLVLPAPSVTSGSSLIGSNGSLLVFQTYSESAAGITSTVFSVPEGKLSTKATTIGGPFAGLLVSTLMASPTASVSGDLLFLSTMDETKTGVSYSSDLLTPSGKVVETALPNTVWGEIFGSPEPTANLLQIKGITDTDGGYGGATINLFNLESLETTALTTASDGSYVVPKGYIVELSGFYGTGIGAGMLIPIGDPSAPYIGAAVDVSHHVILPFDLKNTSVSLIF
jgi:hypothetical protein